MNKDELSNNFRNQKKNLAKLKLKRKKLSKLLNEKSRIKGQVPDTTITNTTELNNDIRSKNQINSKVENSALRKITRLEELEDEIFDTRCQINDLKEVTTDTRIRFEALTEREQEIIKAFYFEGNTYEEIGNILYFDLFKQTRDRKTIKKIIENAIDKMIKI